MKVPMTPENKEKCICMSCLTYTQKSLWVVYFAPLARVRRHLR